MTDLLQDVFLKKWCSNFTHTLVKLFDFCGVILDGVIIIPSSSSSSSPEEEEFLPNNFDLTSAFLYVLLSSLSLRREDLRTDMLPTFSREKFVLLNSHVPSLPIIRNLKYQNGRVE